MKASAGVTLVGPIVSVLPVVDRLGIGLEGGQGGQGGQASPATVQCRGLSLQSARSRARGRSQLIQLPCRWQELEQLLGSRGAGGAGLEL